MDKFVISGGNRLSGEVTISGAKNAAVAVIPAAILIDGVCRIENIPDIKDVKLLANIIKELGVTVRFIDPNTIELDATTITNYCATYDMVEKMRASYYLMGALLGRWGKARVSMPGGCWFGPRPIDQHLKGFSMLGASHDLKHGYYDLNSQSLVGAQIYMDQVSVGATINVMLAATRAEGITVIENAAKEPYIVDVANFLNIMGANIKGAGTDVIKINGTTQTKGGTYSIIPDDIEAGTYMIAVAATGGDVLIKDVIPKHLETLTAKLIEMGVIVEEFDDSIRVISSGSLKATNVRTQPYPGFPTDLQPLMVALLSTAKGTSIVREEVWDNRFQYANELVRIGANIRVDGRSAVIEGVAKLTGCSVRATDLRAGACMIVAALAANGRTEIHDIHHIDRGYEKIADKLKMLGADIQRVTE